MPQPQRRRLRPVHWLALVPALLVMALLLCEALGWRFLREPAERFLAGKLQREVQFDGEWRLHLLGPLRLSGAHVQLGAPDWSQAPHLLDAEDLHLKLSWHDLLAAREGAALRIRALTARRLDVQLERLADGRASWHFGPAKAQPADTPARDFDIDDLELREGHLAYRDAVLKMTLEGTASLDEAHGLALQARGDYRGQPLALDVKATQPMPLLSAAAATPPVPLTLRLQARGTTLAFDGKAVDALRLRELDGHFDVKGASLADVGEVLGLTLPATGPFLARGNIQQRQQVWTADLAEARIAKSELNGHFTFDPTGQRAVLRGTLGGSRLLLADLAPAVGVAPATTPAVEAATPGRAGAAARERPRRTRVLPDAKFNLPTLRNMDADLRIDLATLDLGRFFSEPLQPFKAHLTLREGVLGVADIEARTAKGSVAGRLDLDARHDAARWTADLRWRDVRLEQWLAAGQDRSTPYIAGRFDGAAKVTGEGRSTAEILGSLNGELRGQLRNGELSHVITEVVGLDLAQAIGVWLKGDEPLPLGCAQAQVQFKDGVAVPQVLVLDSADTTIWVAGQVSLKQETLDLHVKAAPKDISPLSLRSPVDIGGTLAAPAVSIQRTPLLRKLLPAAALALVQPLAALIPLVDTGDATGGKEALSACSHLVRQPVARPQVAATPDKPPER